MVARLKSRYDQPKTMLSPVTCPSIVQVENRPIHQKWALGCLGPYRRTLQQSPTTRRIDLGTVPTSFLPEECLARWNEYTSTTKTPPTLGKLREFLQEKSDILSDDSCPSPSSGSSRQRDKLRSSVLHAQGGIPENSATTVCKDKHPV